MAPELENYWFAHQRTGCCDVKAIAWQGWLATSLYGASVTLAAALLVERSVIALVALMALATILFLMLVAAKTRGGLRRRRR